jgi:putative ABC transport system permease protein
MNLTDYFIYNYKTLKKEKIRSFLTIFGIVIGITAIIVLVGLGQGLKQNIDELISSFGANNIAISPGNQLTQVSFSPAIRPSVGKLYEKDMKALESIVGVRKVLPVLSYPQSVYYKNQKIDITIITTYPEDIAEIYKDYYKISEGRELKNSDSKVAVIGDQIAKNTFDKEILVGQTIEIGPNKEKFVVVGRFEKKGSIQGLDVDSSIFINFKDAKDIFEKYKKNKELDAILVNVYDGFDTQQIAQLIESKLAALHKVSLDEKDFTVSTVESIKQRLDTITNAVSLFLLGIASISLLVGGIGIMNTMYASVLQRTYEIGVLKATGATKKDILILFLIESALLGFAGGVIALIISFLFFLAINFFGFKVSLDLLTIVGAILFGVGIGVISGYLPAKKATEIEPIECLRYE